MNITNMLLAILFLLIGSAIIAYYWLISRGWIIKFIFTPKKIDKNKLKGLLAGTAHLAKNPPKGRKKLPIPYDEGRGER